MATTVKNKEVVKVEKIESMYDHPAWDLAVNHFNETRQTLADYGVTFDFGVAPEYCPAADVEYYSIHVYGKIAGYFGLDLTITNELSVSEFYIKPQYRTAKYLRPVKEFLIAQAEEKNAVNIEMHLLKGSISQATLKTLGIPIYALSCCLKIEKKEQGDETR